MKQSLIIILIIHSFVATAQIRLNEMQSSNSTTITDDFGEYEDWVEIHNPTANSIEIGGLVLKDQLDTWAIPTGDPSTLLPPGGYFLLWADDQAVQGIFHTNFKLASGGEFLGLYESDSVSVIDSISIPALSSDQSYIRCDFGWLTSTSPTPLTVNNCTTGLGEIDSSDDLFNITFKENGTLTIDLKNDLSSKTSFVLFTVDGKQVIDLELNKKTTNIRPHLIRNGIYIAVLNNSGTVHSKRIWVNQ